MGKPLKRISRPRVPPPWRSKIASTQDVTQSNPVTGSIAHNPESATAGTLPLSPNLDIEGAERSAISTLPKSDVEKVGYCNPPKRTQFKKGQSGNPKGRQKGLKNYETLWNEHLTAKVRVVENGREVTKSKQELIVLGTINKAVKGDHKATLEVLKQSGKYRSDVAPPLGSSDGSAPQQLSPIEKLILKQLHLEEFFPEAGNKPTGSENPSHDINGLRLADEGELQ